MRKRNYTVTIRMNKAEYDLLQSKVKESGQTQQAVVLHAIADLKIESAEEVEELKKLNQMLAETLSQLRGAATNINQITRKAKFRRCYANGRSFVLPESEYPQIPEGE